MAEKIKVLFLSADPGSTGARLRLDVEVRTVTEAIRKARERDSLEFVSEWAVRAGDLQHALLWHKPAVVHFSGHGTGTDGIFLEDGQGNARAVSKEALAGLFTILRRSIRVVVLNACETQPTVEAFRSVVDYTVGMNTIISDRAAICFAEGFYGALAFGMGVEDAFALGVNRLREEGIPESDAPRLFVREGADSNPLIVPARPPEPEESAPMGPISLRDSTVNTMNVNRGDHALFINN